MRLAVRKGAAAVRRALPEIVMVASGIGGVGLVLWGLVDATGWVWLWKVGGGLFLFAAVVGLRYGALLLWGGLYVLSQAPPDEE